MSSEPKDENWAEPRSLEDAIQRRDHVLSEVQDIQDQLGDRNRLAVGRCMADDEYWEWRGKAKTALKYKLTEYRRLKAWVQLNRSWLHTPPPTPMDELNPVEVSKQLRAITGQLYSVFLAVGTYIEDRSEDNLRMLATIYERAAISIESN
jgi:hypothetical protein